MSASTGSGRMVAWAYVKDVPILLQKSFCTGDQKFSGLETRFLCKDVGDLIT
jgi:hypothetical protein